MEILPLLESLGSSGVVGAILGVMLWFNYKLVTKLFKVIETNTETIVSINETQKGSISVIAKNTDIIQGSIYNQQSHIEQSTRTHNEVHQINLKLQDIETGVESLLKKEQK